MKGIILAGGKGSRLYPLTDGISKQLMPVYDKPLIYYPLSVLMLSGITEIMIITTEQDLEKFRGLLRDGSQLGIHITYTVQSKPVGLPDAFILAENFIGNDSCCMILGDNIFYGYNLRERLRNNCADISGAHVYAYRVQDPQNYGVVSFDRNGLVTDIEEKPVVPKSNYVIPGIYYYDSSVCQYAKQLRPSKRGELEITDLNRLYLQEGNLKVEVLGRGVAWLDAGTPDGLLDASNYIQAIEKRQGFKIACIEEIAYRMGYISLSDLEKLIKPYQNCAYGQYIMTIVKEVEFGILSHDDQTASILETI